MTYTAVLDISSIVWDEDDFNQNMDEYYNLKDNIVTAIEQIELERPSILMRKGLLDLVINGFPCSVIPQFHEFSTRIYSFLGNIGSDILEYDNGEGKNITSIPSLTKAYYPEEMNDEIDIQICEMHLNEGIDCVYLTFKYLWDGTDKLRTLVNTEKVKEHRTIVSDENEGLIKFFRGLKKVFKHNPKHHSGNVSGNYVSPLSCYVNDDNTIPQSLLDNAMGFGKRMYNFDEVNNVYVVFVKTIGNEYHAYDEVDMNRIPPLIRKRYNK